MTPSVSPSAFSFFEGFGWFSLSPVAGLTVVCVSQSTGSTCGSVCDLMTNFLNLTNLVSEQSLSTIQV